MNFSFVSSFATVRSPYLCLTENHDCALCLYVLSVWSTYCEAQSQCQSRKTVNPAHLDRTGSPDETLLQLLSKDKISEQDFSRGIRVYWFNISIDIYILQLLVANVYDYREVWVSTLTCWEVCRWSTARLVAMVFPAGLVGGPNRAVVSLALLHCPGPGLPFTLHQCFAPIHLL